MKVKEIEKTANIAWSPTGQHPVYLAAGTAAQQFDATFSTSAALDIYQLDLSDASLDMKQVGTLPSDQRYHKLAWGSHGLGGSEMPSGVLIGGTDNGKIHVWNSDSIVKGTDPVITTLSKHSGAVAALDFNPFQPNLLASGASESEIFIWDLNNTSNPMTPGAKSQPPDDVTCVGWNHQVQHILASTYAGRCVVWDLRKNEPIIKVSDSMSRIKCKLVAWHPDVATQMCLASEDDHSPIIQLWDLRFATSPLKTLENHTRGILSMAWCPQDPDLLLSCGKDNRILCWNPNTAGQMGEVVYELPTSNQWTFDVQWCPRNPAIISSCSFDGHVSVYSLMGGGKVPEPSSKIADSFPTDPFAQPPAHMEKTEAAAPTVALKKPPKWLRRPVGASFGFGGKLVTFEHTKPSHPQQPTQKLVQISQVVTETELIARSNQLEYAVNNNQFSEFCSMKIANSKNDMDESIWNFLKVPFEGDPRSHYLQLLGYDQQDLAKKVAEATCADVCDPQENGGVDADELAQKMAQLNSGSAVPQHMRKLIASGQSSPFLQENQTPSSDSFGPSDGSSAFDQIASQEQDSRPDSPLPISTSDDVDGLVTQALLMANFEAAVEVCLKNDRLAEAIILAIAGGPELLARTQKKVFQSSKSSLNRLISSVVTKDFEHVIRTCDLDSWKEALALALTYCRGQQFSTLCELLGVRLENERNGELAANACLCYICAGNVERLVSCWDRITDCTGSPLGLQDLVEKVMVLRRAVECATGQATNVTGPLLADKLSKYSDLLAAQGNLTTALNYLGESSEMPLAILRDRLTSSLGMPAGGRPFHVINVQAVLPPRQVAQPAVPAGAPGARQRTPSGHYQAQAGGTFQTTTTPTSMYSVSQNAYAQPATQPHQPAYYQPTIPSTQTATSKGSFTSKYGAYVAPGTNTPAVPTSVYNPYSQPQIQQKLQPNPYDPTSYQAPVPAPQPSMFNPAVSQETPELPLGSTKTNLARWRHNRYNDSERIAGVVGTATPPHSRRHSIYSTEHEVPTPTGAPYVPPTSSMHSYQEVRPQTAWNDPPVLKNKKAEDKSFEPVTPITQPLFGAQPEQAPPGAPNYGGTQIYNPGNYPSQPPQRAPEPPKPIEKGPIPAEHQVLQDVFDRLANLCINGTNHLQTKRKLEDVLRKLEALYDKLREQSLSPGIVMGLHQVVQYVQAYDYQTGLQYVTQLISQSNFSEISSFMPGVKMLLQTASHMQVYLQ